MKVIKILKWMIYISLWIGAILDSESRTILIMCFFAIASICSGVQITTGRIMKKSEWKLDDKTISSYKKAL